MPDPSQSDRLTTAEVDAAAAAERALCAGERQVITLFPVSLLWAHKGLLLLVVVAGALGAALGHGFA